MFLKEQAERNCLQGGIVPIENGSMPVRFEGPLRGHREYVKGDGSRAILGHRQALTNTSISGATSTE